MTKIYKVKSPFMSRPGQFEPGKSSLCIGVEADALKKAGEYSVYLGTSKRKCYDVTYDEAMGFVAQFGKNAQWVRKGKQVFILPVLMLRVKDLVIEVK